jgi:ABC-type glutathione transport system ATPase component
MMTETPVLQVDGLVKHYPVRGGLFGRAVAHVRAVDGISFAIAPGETLGLVGESGCGKSTVGKAILRLVEPTAGRVTLEGEDITALGRAAMIAKRRRMQVIFQDPYSSLNPRMTAGDIVQEPLVNFGIGTRAEQRERVDALFARVGLRPDQRRNYPHEFSGGQRQRIGIARALAVKPDIVIADEPTSALDVTVQAEVVGLLRRVRDERGTAMLFISHDLAVIGELADRVVVMRRGEVVEVGGARDVLISPSAEYTRELIAAVPRIRTAE